MVKIIDCITYFRETFVTKLRIEILKDVVDKFIICESIYDHRSRSKNVNFSLHSENLKQKVEHIVINHKFPEPDDPWKCQKYQRDYMLGYLDDINDDDFIMFSDPDEIPNPNILREFVLKKKYGIFMQKHFVYNFKLIDQYQNPWAGTRICKKKNLKSFDDLKHKILKKNLKKWWRPDKEKNIELIDNGGWHFNNFFSAKEISTKLKTFAHSEFSGDEFSSEEVIKKKIENRIDLFNRGHTYKILKMDQRFPEYLLKNYEKYKNFIL